MRFNTTAIKMQRNHSECDHKRSHPDFSYLQPLLYVFRIYGFDLYNPSPSNEDDLRPARSSSAASGLKQWAQLLHRKIILSFYVFSLLYRLAVFVYTSVGSGPETEMSTDVFCISVFAVVQTAFIAAAYLGYDYKLDEIRLGIRNLVAAVQEVKPEAERDEMIRDIRTKVYFSTFVVCTFAAMFPVLAVFYTGTYMPALYLQFPLTGRDSLAVTDSGHQATLSKFNQFNMVATLSLYSSGITFVWATECSFFIILRHLELLFDQLAVSGRQLVASRGDSAQGKHLGLLLRDLPSESGGRDLMQHLERHGHICDLVQSFEMVFGKCIFVYTSANAVSLTLFARVLTKSKANPEVFYIFCAMTIISLIWRILATSSVNGKVVSSLIPLPGIASPHNFGSTDQQYTNEHRIYHLYLTEVSMRPAQLTFNGITSVKTAFLFSIFSTIITYYLILDDV